MVQNGLNGRGALPCYYSYEGLRRPLAAGSGSVLLGTELVTRYWERSWRARVARIRADLA